MNRIQHQCKKQKLKQAELACSISLMLSAGLLSSSAWAQTNPAANPSTNPTAQVTEGITVSASRIELSGFEAPTPTTTVGAADLNRLAVTNVVDALNLLPAFRPTQSSTILAASAYPGASFLDLRGLGTTRTLTLVDGRRFVATNVTGQFDLNVIPASMIERTEVVTGGASAAWGSDAVAGVANIILKKNIEGLQGSVQVGSSSHHDNRGFNVSLAWGTAFASGRGHVSVAGEYDKSGEVKYISDRDWGNKATGTINNPAAGSGQPPFVVTDNVNNIQGAPGGLIVAAGGGNPILPASSPLRGIQFGPGSVPTTFDYGLVPAGSTVNAIGGSGISILGSNPIKTPSKRATLFTNASFDITDNLQVFTQISYAENKNEHGHGNWNYDLGGNSLTILSDNGYLNTLSSLAPVKAAMGAAPSFQLGRINVDFGVPDINVTSKVKRFVGGFKGRIGEDWTWSTYYEKGDTDYKQRIYNTRIGANAPFTPNAANTDLNNHWGQAIDTIVLNGAVVCRNATARAQGCQPLNPFGSGAYSQAAKDYVTGTQAQDQTLKQTAFEASIQGAAFDNWAGPVSLATGVAYRKDSMVATVDPLSQAGAYWFGNPKAFGGELSVKELFGETNVPLLADKPFVKALGINLAFRRLDYSNSGLVNTWKTGATWEVNDEIKFRATRSRDIRAPNINELFSVTTQRNASVTDPLNGNAAVFPASLLGGNTNLKPEKSITNTMGVVLQPSAIKNFRASVDVYKIDIRDAINTPDAQLLVNACATGSSLCQGEVVRSSTNTITSILLVNKNIAYIKTKGVDVELAYATNVPDTWGGGKLNVRWLATYLDYMLTNLSGTAEVNSAGQTVTGQGGAPTFTSPHLTWTGTATYAKGPYSVSAQVRYVGAANINNYATAANIVNNNSLPSVTYLGLSGDYVISQSALSRLQVYWAIDNVFDKAPPYYASAGQQISYANPVWYDQVGRTFRLGLRFKY